MDDAALDLLCTGAAVSLVLGTTLGLLRVALLLTLSVAFSTAVSVPDSSLTTPLSLMLRVTSVNTISINDKCA